MVMPRKFNRYATALIAVISWLSANALDLPTKTINYKEYYYYKVESKESIYSVSRKLGVSKEDIIKYNPSVADGLRKHITLYFPVSAFADATESTKESGQKTSTYKVKDKETLYSIARNNGLTVRDIEEVNPDLSILKKGQYINLPDRVKVTEVTAQKDSIKNDSIASIPDTVQSTGPQENGSIDIAILLPFMLDEENPSKRALLYTDFYKGFLIATDSLRNTIQPVNIYTYDTADSTGLVNEILKRDDMKKADIIIASENDEHLRAITDFASINGCKVMNIFSVKNNLYTTHDNILHANIPPKEMYKKATSHFVRNLDGYTPVFIVNSETHGDKEEYVTMLKSCLDSESEHYEEIFFTSALQVEDLSSLNDSTQYIFVPQSGSHAELNKILPTLISFKGQSPDPRRIRLSGYPEWTTFRGETLERMHELNTTVYSRFFNDPECIQSQRISELFKKWYGTEMIPTAPLQGTLGFDTGMFILSMYSNYGRLIDIPAYNGIQNGFRFSKPDSARGNINDTLYFIDFLPDGTIKKTSY